jgi:GntR family phosphonate transport system transcriptional regulator
MLNEGISRWRQVGDALAHEIGQGELAAGDKLPAMGDLADRFGVALETMRRAVQHLQSQGMLRVEHGRGTFVTEKALAYRIAPRSWFEQNVLANARTPSRDVLSLGSVRAAPAIAEKLAIAVGDPVLLAVMVGKGDGVPLTLGRNYFPIGRLARLPRIFARAARRKAHDIQVSAMLKEAGVKGFRRREIRLRARPASQEEQLHLQLAEHECVVATDVLSVDHRDVPVSFSSLSYSSSRVEFVIDREMFAGGA